MGRVALLCSIMIASVAWAQKRPQPPISKVPPKGRPLPRWPQKQPDPTPMVTRGYLDVTVRLEKSKLKVVKIVKGSFVAPKAIAPRFGGRFEIKLYGGTQLRDVIRFNLPLTAGSSDSADLLGRGLGLGVSAHAVIRVPFDESVTGGVVFDTANKTQVKLELAPFHTKPKLQLPVDPLRASTFKKPSKKNP
jgi:hypothetical protein